MSKDVAKNASVYRAYTTKFDRVVSASDLDAVLGPLTFKAQLKLDEAWTELQSGLLPWKTKLHIAGRELTELICSEMARDEREGTVVSLLFDQSGSMRGQKMLFSAASADVAQEFLASLGIGCEVLGFTTADWRGGRSRRRWKWRFRPRNPGRLNDLLHVVYRDVSDNRVSTGGWIYRQMLRADLPKENIDGEAIEWAASRLRAIPRKRKILIVLSDGAPVDDSTLNENGPEFLADHLQNVVEDLKSESDIEIAAFGIGFACHHFYPRTHNVDNLSDLGLELLRFLTAALLKREGNIPITSASEAGSEDS
ncbi:cobaltochelatase CobT-related protein [Parablastomonas sp. CN1-191]|uniref:cobaltochelatase CobT-related protein n=1 Tax=Parablastomonas sp. CN1-191 TaxID=3400908 RepID=UPI003BF88F2B